MSQQILFTEVVSLHELKFFAEMNKYHLYFLSRLLLILLGCMTRFHGLVSSRYFHAQNLIWNIDWELWTSNTSKEFLRKYICFSIHSISPAVGAGGYFSSLKLLVISRTCIHLWCINMMKVDLDMGLILREKTSLWRWTDRLTSINTI